MTYNGPLPPDIWDVLHRAWKGGVSLQSDFARQHAMSLALAASLGWLSTVDPEGTAYRNVWRITASGLTALQYKDTFG